MSVNFTVRVPRFTSVVVPLMVGPVARDVYGRPVRNLLAVVVVVGCCEECVCNHLNEIGLSN